MKNHAIFNYTRCDTCDLVGEEFSFIPHKSKKTLLIPRSPTPELLIIYTSALHASGINNAVSTFLRVQNPSMYLPYDEYI